MQLLELTEDCLHPRYDGEHVTFGVFIPKQGDLETFDNDEDKSLREALVHWAEGEDVSVLFRFSVRACIAAFIDEHQFQQVGPDVVMDEDYKPLVEAMRAELLEMIGKLDGIKFMPFADFKAVAGASIPGNQQLGT